MTVREKLSRPTAHVRRRPRPSHRLGPASVRTRGRSPGRRRPAGGTTSPTPNVTSVRSRSSLRTASTNPSRSCSHPLAPSRGRRRARIAVARARGEPGSLRGRSARGPQPSPVISAGPAAGTPSAARLGIGVEPEPGGARDSGSKSSEAGLGLVVEAGPQDRASFGAIWPAANVVQNGTATHDRPVVLGVVEDGWKAPGTRRPSFIHRSCSREGWRLTRGRAAPTGRRSRARRCRCHREPVDGDVAILVWCRPGTRWPRCSGPGRRW